MQPGKGGRRAVVGAVGGVHSAGDRKRSPYASVNQKSNHGLATMGVVAGGALVLAVGLFTTGVLAEYALAFAGAGFMCGIGAGFALGEGGDR